MAFFPTWNANFAKPLVNQAIAIIQRDQASVIMLVNPALTPISEFHKGPALQTSFPWLMIAANHIDFEAAYPLTRASRVSLAMMLDVGQFDREIAQDEAQDYAHLLDMIITSASGSDWESPLPIVQETVPPGMTSPPESGSVKRVFVQSHHYSLVNQTGLSSPILRAALSVVFELQET